MAVLATAVWRIRPSGTNGNGGGYDSGIAGAATDYSQQNAAQATGTNGAGSATTTFTDATANAFTAAMVGNAINISGQGFYFVTAFLNATQVTVDRALGTFTLASWRLGGGWIDPTNLAPATNPAVGGNVVYVLGSGLPNVAAPDYTWTNLHLPATTSGFLTLANDPATPGYKGVAPSPDTTGGMPTIRVGASSTGLLLDTNNSFIRLQGLYFFVQDSSSAMVNVGVTSGVIIQVQIFGCVFDLNSFSSICLRVDTTATPIATTVFVLGCEFFSSSAGTTNVNNALVCTSGNCIFYGCNFHDLPTGCILMFNSGTLLGKAYLDVRHCIFSNLNVAGLGADAIQFSQACNGTVINNTFDGAAHSFNGIHWAGAVAGITAYTVVMNNLFTNLANVLTCDTGTGVLNKNSALFEDYDVWWNNTTNQSGFQRGNHITTIPNTSPSPYVNQSVEDYTLAQH